MKESANSLLDQIIIFLASHHLVLGYVLTTILLLISFVISMQIAVRNTMTKDDFSRLVDFTNFNARNNHKSNLLSR
jgi:hypothetical protein